MAQKNDEISREIDLKRKLVEATETVRKKFNIVKNRNAGEKLALEKFYEPIMKPLKNISKAAKDVKDDNFLAPHHSLKTEMGPLPKRLKSTNSSSDDDSSDQYEDFDTSSYSSDIPPITQDMPPSSIATTSVKSRSSAHIKSIPSGYVDDLRSNESGFDTIYGVRIDPDTGKLLMGNAEVRFSGNNISIWRGGRKLKTFGGNTELYDLIFLKQPAILSSPERVISEGNLKTYGEIMSLTNAAYKDYNIRLGRNGSRSKKYLEIIKPLSSHQMTTRRSKYSGTGTKYSKIPNQKRVNLKATNYVYWNKPKELVDRLRLLWSSKMAGHTGHDNEILSIIEELREEGVVY